MRRLLLAAAAALTLTTPAMAGNGATWGAHHDNQGRPYIATNDFRLSVNCYIRGVFVVLASNEANYWNVMRAFDNANGLAATIVIDNIRWRATAKATGFDKTGFFVMIEIGTEYDLETIARAFGNGHVITVTFGDFNVTRGLGNSGEMLGWLHDQCPDDSYSAPVRGGTSL